jgi:hypothetical protein
MGHNFDASIFKERRIDVNEIRFGQPIRGGAAFLPSTWEFLILSTSLEGSKVGFP